MDGVFRTCVAFQIRVATLDDCNQYLRKPEISNGDDQEKTGSAEERVDNEKQMFM
jgi:hypothetical protein